MELTDIITVGNSLVETPSDSIIQQRIAVINFFSLYHSICCGDWPDGLKQKIYNPCSSQSTLNKVIGDFGYLKEDSVCRLMDKVLMIAEAVFNTDIYDRLVSVLERLGNRSWEYIRSSNTWILKNVEDYNKAQIELSHIILKMTNLLYKKKFLGHFIGVKLKI